MHKLSLFASLFFIMGCLPSQQMMPALPNSQVDLKEGDVIYQIQLLPDPSKVKLNEQTTYYWFAQGKIQRSVGNFNGKLLDGNFIATHIDGELLEKGFYKEGVKDGKWQQWYQSGQTKKIYTWDKGALDGDFIAIDSLGSIIKKGTYKSGELDGTIYQLNSSNQLDTLKYKKGKLLIEEKSAPKKKLKRELKSTSQTADSLTVQ